MKTQTQQSDIGEQLQKAVLSAAMGEEGVGLDQEEKPAKKPQKGGVSTKNGVRTPAGRPKGVRNRLTNIRDAVIEAFDTVGGAAYLVSLAKGTQSDRAAFVGLMSKVLPTQVNASVEGGVRLELSWLGNRSIGTTSAQEIEHKTQVIDLQQDSEGQYRIKHPVQDEKPPEK